MRTQPHTEALVEAVSALKKIENRLLSATDARSVAVLSTVRQNLKRVEEILQQPQVGAREVEEIEQLIDGAVTAALEIYPHRPAHTVH